MSNQANETTSHANESRSNITAEYPSLIRPLWAICKRDLALAYRQRAELM